MSALQIKNVLISDAVDESCLALLKENNINVTCKYGLSKEELVKEIPKYDGLVVRSDTKVTAEVIAASNLKVIGRAGTGVDNIDLNAATKKGVIVINAPTGNFISACELTCSLILALARHVAQGCQSLKERKWNRKLYSGSELYGKTLAVIGLGKIGREVAFRMQAFGMKVISLDPMVSKEDASKINIELLELNQIWPRADYITVHTPLIPQTKNLINSDVLQSCKKGVKIINVARGGIVDEQALLENLKSGQCGGAALDVFCEEPPKSESTFELIQHPKVVVTPHLGASTAEAQIRVAVEIAEQFIALANLNPKYTSANGVVNAPALAATRKPENTSWISLGNYLGQIAEKIFLSSELNKINLSLVTEGESLKDKKFLTTHVQIGFLNKRVLKDLNFINVDSVAQAEGLTIQYEHKSNTTGNYVNLKCSNGVATYNITGTVKRDVPYFLGIGDAKFEPEGVVLNNQIVFYKLDQNQTISFIINDLIQNNISFSSVNIANGKTSWVAVTLSKNSQFKNYSSTCFSLE